MSAGALLDKLNRAGAKLEVVNGKVRVRGAKISEDLMLALRADRADVLAEFERRKMQNLDRYGLVPPPDARMLAREIVLSDSTREQVISYALRQPRPVHAWIMARANDYYASGLKAEDCEWRACVDLTAWQRSCGAGEATEFIAGMLCERATKGHASG
jgi:hypothetical protein